MQPAACLRGLKGLANLDWIPMATPCRKCGAQKTEDPYHGLLYSLAKACGYRLRICSRCRRRRFLPLARPRLNDLDEPERLRREEPAQANLAINPGVEANPPGACPKCGKVDFRRSRRRSWERMIGRGPMVRCRACQTRFPLPQPADRVD